MDLLLVHLFLLAFYLFFSTESRCRSGCGRLKLRAGFLFLFLLCIIVFKPTKIVVIIFIFFIFRLNDLGSFYLSLDLRAYSPVLTIIWLGLSI